MDVRGPLRSSRLVTASLSVLVATLAVAALAPAADAALGDLTPLGCIDDNDTGSDTCAGSTDGLDRAEGIAASSDGKSVYAVSSDDSAVVEFRRSPATGALTPRRCIDSSFGPDTCASSIPYLLDPEDVTVSPDGGSVYVISRFGDSGVYNFRRDTDTGRLTFVECVGDSDFPACTKNMVGIDDPTAVTVSPDGASVYVADFGGNSVAWMRRNTTTGRLTPQNCVADNDSGFDEPCPNDANGLSAATDVVVSPDGEQVYVASAFDNAVVRFNRNTTTGALNASRCYDDNDNGSESCLFDTDGLGRPEGIAISPDGNSVYVASFDDDALVRFDRGANGALAERGCYVDNEYPGEPCADSPLGLTGAHAVQVSPDNQSVYVASKIESGIAQFGRAPSGALTGQGCIKDDEAIADYQNCPATTNGLAFASDVAVTANGASVYASAGFNDHAVVAFDRDQGP
jgi:DNA-binding beta-propeller fold protein YncE